MNRDHIENTLRKAPPVKTPEGLLAELHAAIQLPRPPSTATNYELRAAHRFNFRRWLPTLGFALWFLGCVVVFGIQAIRIAELREQQEVLQSAKFAAAQSAQVAEAASAAAVTELEQLKKDVADVQRLRTETEQLRTELAELPRIRTENERLRAVLKPPIAVSVAPEQDFFADQAERADRKVCISNLKQVGLAARLWARDHGAGDVLAPSYEAMKAELITDKNTFCPSDGTTRYDLLSPGASERAEPHVVFTRCPIHQNVGLADGSAQMLGEKQKVVQREGKWVIE